MARDFAKQFYSSKTWQACRNEYAKRQHYLCENCLRRGIYKPGIIVHHVINLTPENIEQPSITLNPDNFMLLCRDCHAEIHKARAKGRNYYFGENGEVIVVATPPLSRES